jgi:hypothetical protein
MKSLATLTQRKRNIREIDYFHSERSLEVPQMPRDDQISLVDVLVDYVMAIQRGDMLVELCARTA